MEYDPKFIGGRVILLLDNRSKTTEQLISDYQKKYGELNMDEFRKEIGWMRRASFIFLDESGRWFPSNGIGFLSVTSE